MIVLEKSYLEIILSFQNVKEKLSTDQPLFSLFVGRPSVDIGGGVPSIGLPKYDALEDPHLHEYFVRRFSSVPFRHQSVLSNTFSVCS